MIYYDLLLYAHILLFVYWLGSDVGVYYGIRYFIRPDLSVEARQTVMAVIHWIDLFPRVCLVLMVPVGLTLSVMSGLIPLAAGLKLPVLVASWAIGLAWLAAVMRIYKGGAAKALILADTVVRVSVMLGFILAGILSLMHVGPVIEGANWLAVKFILFGAVIACGLSLRFLGRPTAEAFAQIAAGNGTPEIEQKLSTSVAQAKRVVLVLWSLVAIIGFLGLTKLF